MRHNTLVWRKGLVYTTQVGILDPDFRPTQHNKHPNMRITNNLEVQFRRSVLFHTHCFHTWQHTCIRRETHMNYTICIFGMRLRRTAGYSDRDDKIRSPWTTWLVFWTDSLISKATLYSERIWGATLLTRPLAKDICGHDNTEQEIMGCWISGLRKAWLAWIPGLSSILIQLSPSVLSPRMSKKFFKFPWVFLSLYRLYVQMRFAPTKSWVIQKQYSRF